MKRRLMWSGIIGVLLLVILVPVKADTEVTVGITSLKLGGLGQFTAQYFDDVADSPSKFKLKRARLFIWGTIIPDKVKFFVQTDGTGSPYVLDSKLILGYIPKTSLIFGRMLPNFSLYMPQSTGKLDLVNYPLSTLKYAMWRQTGIESISKLKFVDLTFGIFNGYQDGVKGNDWGDNNDAKDFLARVDIKPAKGLKIGLFTWLGSPYDPVADDDFDANRYGANVEWKSDFLQLCGEYIMGDNNKSVDDNIDSFAMFAQVLVPLMDKKIELILRQDYYEPDKDSDNDEEAWTTFGFNYKILKYNTMFYLNYIYKSKDIYDADGHKLDDHESEVVFQAQYMF